MKTTALLLTLLLLPMVAEARDSWTSEDTAREASYLILHTIDWGQTRHISNNCDRFREGNVFLGDCPSLKEVDQYFALTGLAHVGISYVLPREWRKAWQYITIGIETGAVGHNYKAGVSIDF